MSEMKGKPIFLCRVCGAPVTVKVLRTTVSDPEGEMLDKWMRDLQKIASLCPEHQKVRNWYIQQGRYEEWKQIGQY